MRNFKEILRKSSHLPQTHCFLVRNRCWRIIPHRILGEWRAWRRFGHAREGRGREESLGMERCTREMFWVCMCVWLLFIYIYHVQMTKMPLKEHKVKARERGNTGNPIFRTFSHFHNATPNFHSTIFHSKSKLIHNSSIFYLLNTRPSQIFFFLHFSPSKVQLHK